jgi:hypothetical protein
VEEGAPKENAGAAGAAGVALAPHMPAGALADAQWIVTLQSCRCFALVPVIAQRSLHPQAQKHINPLYLKLLQISDWHSSTAKQTQHQHAHLRKNGSR